MALGGIAGIDIIAAILKGEDPLMPKKYQNAKLELRTDVKRPYYFVRATVVRTDDVTGKRRRVRIEHKIGFQDEMPRKEAMMQRAAILEGVNSGRFVAPANVKFSELVKRYEQIIMPELGTASRKQRQSQIKNHISPYFGEMKLGEIDRFEVERFLTSKGETLSWWARKNLRSILGALFIAAKDWRLVSGDLPTTGARLGRKSFAREKRLLLVDDLRRLIAALEDRERFVVTIIFGCGLRISEVLGLKWSDIDFEKGVMHVRRRWYRGEMSEDGTGKTQSSIDEVFLGASMMSEFAQRFPGVQARQELIFIGEDGKNPPDEREMLRYRFRPVAKRLGLYYQGFGWHAFKRQHTSWRQSVGGASALEAQKASRHASLDMSYLYTLRDRERETLAQQRMFDALAGAVEGKTQ